MGGGGSGFIYDSDTIITAKHVVEPPDEISIKLSDGSLIKVKKVWKSPTEDVAFLDMESKTKLPPLRISPKVPVFGTRVFAQGYPLDFNTVAVTEGLVGDAFKDDTYGKKTLLAFSSDIIYGNSGGPVYNEKGEVVSIVNCVRTSEFPVWYLNGGVTGETILEEAKKRKE
jgi:S1-C subfamily serine protease